MITSCHAIAYFLVLSCSWLLLQEEDFNGEKGLLTIEFLDVFWLLLLLLFFVSWYGFSIGVEVFLFDEDICLAGMDKLLFSDAKIWIVLAAPVLSVSFNCDCSRTWKKKLLKIINGRKVNFSL